LNRNLTSDREKKSSHIAMQRAIGLAQSTYTTPLIIAVHCFPLNKTTRSDPITPAFTSTTSPSTVQLRSSSFEEVRFFHHVGMMASVEQWWAKIGGKINTRKKKTIQKEDYLCELVEF
jgi:hypothetical protein